jgi:hypothetical protein
MRLWDGWKKGFDAWEDRTARHLETVLRSPLVLGPGGALLTAAMRSKSAVDGAMEAWWSAVGLPTRRDQERSLHALNQLQSRLIDLEESVAELRAERAKPAAPAKD